MSERVSERAALPLEGIELADHPAAQAWRRLNPGSAEPVHVEALWHGKKPHRKSQVFCLHGVGPGGSNIVAKRCSRDTAMVESTVYCEVLSRAPIEALRCHGLLEDTDAESCWLFLEDAGHESYSPLAEEHRAIASHWLAMMHVATAAVADSVRLPERGPDAYRQHLLSARGRIQLNLANPALNDDDRELLRSVVSQCDRLQASWERIDAFCRRMPRTLVHGDFVAKNLGMRTGRSGLALLALDWEFSGWGNPAADLAECPDLLIYESTVQHAWPDLRSDDILQLANVGKVFRQLADLDWQSWRFAYEWLTKPLARLREWRGAFQEATGRLDGALVDRDS